MRMRHCVVFWSRPVQALPTGQAEGGRARGAGREGGGPVSAAVAGIAAHPVPRPLCRKRWPRAPGVQIWPLHRVSRMCGRSIGSPVASFTPPSRCANCSL
jgi:hypothetical protein